MGSRNRLAPLPPAPAYRRPRPRPCSDRGCRPGMLFEALSNEVGKLVQFAVTQGRNGDVVEVAMAPGAHVIALKGVIPLREPLRLCGPDKQGHQLFLTLIYDRRQPPVLKGV